MSYITGTYIGIVTDVTDTWFKIEGKGGLTRRLFFSKYQKDDLHKTVQQLSKLNESEVIFCFSETTYKDEESGEFCDIRYVTKIILNKEFPKKKKIDLKE